VWALAVLWGLPLVAVLGGYLLSPQNHPGGRCEGLGFGCVPSPADTWILLGMLAAPWLFVAGLVVVAVIATVQASQGRNARK
jgi:hypothetical protein